MPVVTISVISALIPDVLKTVKSISSAAVLAGWQRRIIFYPRCPYPRREYYLLEELAVQGGSLDGAGNAKDGYIMRGGREMITTYENFWDMFQDIPALELPEPYSVLDEYRLINDNDPNYSKARLIHNKGEIKDFHKFNLNKADQLAIVRLLLKNQDELDNLTIEDYFSQSFWTVIFGRYGVVCLLFENW